jgi:hypothetical protein
MFSGSGTATLLDLDTDGALTANSDTSIPSQKAVKAYADTKNIATQVTPGTSGNVLTSNGSAWTSAAPSTPVFSASFTSTEQSITAGGALTIAHGLGAAPKMVQFFIKAQSSVLGYSTGDEVEISVNGMVTTNYGVTYTKDATNVNVRFGSNAASMYILRFDTGAAAAITNSDWRLIVRAYV